MLTSRACAIKRCNWDQKARPNPVQQYGLLRSGRAGFHVAVLVGLEHEQSWNVDLRLFDLHDYSPPLGFPAGVGRVPLRLALAGQEPKPGLAQRGSGATDATASCDPMPDAQGE